MSTEAAAINQAEFWAWDRSGLWRYVWPWLLKFRRDGSGGGRLHAGSNHLVVIKRRRILISKTWNYQSQ